MATAALAVGSKENPAEVNAQSTENFEVGVLAGLEWSPEPNAELSGEEESAIKDLCTKAQKRDYPARLIEVIQAWESALFYRGFQFLIPQRGGGWLIPGESTGYGPTMQMDLALLPTNVYSSYAQILISALTRSVPAVRFEPQNASDNAQITAAESADKFVKVIERNNDLIMIQTDCARYLYTDGRAVYWTRFVKDGERFGWEEEDQPNDLIPENEPPAEEALAMALLEIRKETPETSTPPEVEAQEATGQGEAVEPGEDEAPQIVQRKPRGQEVRTVHGKLEMKLVPMMANTLAECSAAQLDIEVDESMAKGMFPDKSDKITSGGRGAAEGEIARLARMNVKLGMQSTYVTSDSIADDVTIQRTWMRRSYLMKVTNKTVRDQLLQKFPDGCLVVYAGDVLCYARNESMDDSLALMQAYSGDGQNRNALGTSMMPVQKRINNWLDLMNDYFVRTVPKKWMDNKAFNIEQARKQSNVPGDIGPVKAQPGKQISDLIYVEPGVTPPAMLSDFVKQYIGPLSELLTGAYPALSGGDTGANDTAHGIAIQRDQALGRLAPTWHSIVNAEAVAMRQAVRWGAKCRDGSINERIPGGETIQLEINNLRANILCFAESDENFPESYTQKQNRLMQFMTESAKNPVLGEALYNPANIAFLQSMVALTDLYIPQVASFDKQNGELELLMKAGPLPNPAFEEAQQAMMRVKMAGAPDQELAPAMKEMQGIPQETSSVPVNQWDDDATEAFACWKFMTSPEGRKAARVKQLGFKNVMLHWQEHNAAMAKKNQGNTAQAKPPNKSMALKDMVGTERAQLLAQGGIKADMQAEAMDQATEMAKAARPPAPAGKPSGPEQRIQ